MGAYLSIVNDTEYVLYCNVGPDEAALQIAGIIVGVVGALATIVATAGTAAPVVTAVSSGVFSLGFTVGTTLAITNAIFLGAGAVATTATAAGFLQVIVDKTIDKIKGDGYVEIVPGGRHQWRTDTVGLWRQGHCRRLTSNAEAMNYVQDEVYMRPIFSSDFVDQNRDHTVQFWVDKFGWENAQTINIPPPEGLTSWGNVHAPLSETLALTMTAPPVAATPAPTSGSVSTPAPTSSPVSTPAPTSGPVSTPAPTSSVVSTPAPTSGSVAALKPEPIVYPVCVVCPRGRIDPDITVSIPGNGNFTCGEIENAGFRGQIPPESCPSVAQFLVPCGCPAPYRPPEECACVDGLPSPSPTESTNNPTTSPPFSTESTNIPTTTQAPTGCKSIGKSKDAGLHFFNAIATTATTH